MRLLTPQIYKQLIRNGEITAQRATEGKPNPDLFPVVKLFTPDGACTWLLTELDPVHRDIAFGLLDLGTGSPEVGSVSISELLEVRGRIGLLVERDQHFVARKSLSAYATEARVLGCIKS